MKEIKSSKYFNIGIIIVVTVYLAFMFLRMLEGCFDEYPREYRDVANSVLALRFAAGENPYVLSEMGDVPSIYVYTPLNILLAAGLYSLTGWQIYTIFHCLDLIYLCAATVIVAIMVAKETRSKLLGFVSMAVTVTLGYRYCFIQACPDRLGILLLILVMYIAAYYKGRYRIVLLSFVTTMAFYAKQYFLVIAVPVFFYVLYKNYKDAIRYFLITAVMGFGSILVINHYCPIFTMEILLFMGVETSKPTADDFAYSMMQFVEFFKRYIWLTIPVILYYAEWAVRFIKTLCLDKEMRKNALTTFLNKTINVYFICVPVIVLVLVRIGQNRGAYLSYHLGLLGPCFVVLGFIAVKHYVEMLPKELWKQLAITCFSVILTLTCYHFYSVLNINKTDEVKAEWERAYATLDEYREAGDEMYLDPTLAYYALDHELPVYDCGQTFFVYWIASGMIKDKPIDSAAYNKVFPHFSQFEEYSHNYVDGIAQKIDNKEFGCIAVVGDSLANRSLEQNYVLTDTVKLKMGVQNFAINIWERR